MYHVVFRCLGLCQHILCVVYIIYEYVYVHTDIRMYIYVYECVLLYVCMYVCM